MCLVRRVERSQTSKGCSGPKNSQATKVEQTGRLQKWSQVALVGRGQQSLCKSFEEAQGRVDPKNTMYRPGSPISDSPKIGLPKNGTFIMGQVATPPPLVPSLSFALVPTFREKR